METKQNDKDNEYDYCNGEESKLNISSFDN